MTLKILTPPRLEPITLDQVKTHLRLLHTQDDHLLDLMITSARERVEAFLNQGLIQQQVVFSSPLPYLKRRGLSPFKTTDKHLRFRIPWRPLLEVESLAFVGNKKRLSVPLKRINVESISGWISFSWWTFPDQSLEIIYQAGYGSTPDHVPAVFREAILELVVAKYERRLSFNEQTQLLHRLLAPHRNKEI